MGLTHLGQVFRQKPVSSVSWKANRDGQSSTERGIRPRQNLGQAAVCSKNGETPYCKGNSIMRSVVGPDCGAENAQRGSREKQD